MKNKIILYVIGGLLLITMILGLIGIAQSKKNPSTDDPAKNPDGDQTITTELKYPESITKTDYSIDEITSKFSFDGYTFTATDLVKLLELIESNTITLKSYTNDKKSNLNVNINVGKVSSISDIIKDDYSDYKVVSQNKTEAKLIKDDTYFKNYVYIKTKFETNIVSDAQIEKEIVNISDNEAFTLMNNAIETISISNNEPYAFDMATFLPLPFDQKLKSYSKIKNIYIDGIQILTDVPNKENGNNYYIEIYYALKSDVDLKNVSENPKIDMFEYKDENYISKTLFRLYDKNNTFDVRVTKSDKENKFSEVKDVKEIIEALNTLNK